MAKTVYMAEAYMAEKPNDRAGWNGTAAAGDQLQTSKEGTTDYKGECRISAWRPDFTMVCRYIDRDKAKAHAEAAKFFVDSKHVGYDQSQRLTLKNYIKSIGYANYRNLNKDKECDCSSLQCLCCNIVGLSAVKDWNTTAMLKEMPKLTNDFIILTDKKYLKSSDYLMTGDILLKNGHAACALNDGELANIDSNTLVEPEVKDDNSIIGDYKTTANLNLRYGPDADLYNIIQVIDKDDEVTCNGSRTNDWYYVTTKKDNNITGFVKSTYLSKIVIEEPQQPVNTDPEPTPTVPSTPDPELTPIPVVSKKKTILASAKSKNTNLAGKYTTTTNVNLRYGPSADEYEVIRVVKKGEAITNYGFYTGSWLFVKDSKGNKGFINKNYLKKK